MDATIKNGILTITIPVNSAPTLSASGKSRLVASSGGNKVTTLKVDGKNVTVGLNAYIKA